MILLKLVLESYSLNIEETFDQTVKNAYFNEKNTLEGYGYNTVYYNNYITKMEEKYKGYYLYEL